MTDVARPQGVVDDVVVPADDQTAYHGEPSVCRNARAVREAMGESGCRWMDAAPSRSGLASASWWCAIIALVVGRAASGLGSGTRCGLLGIQRGRGQIAHLVEGGRGIEGRPRPGLCEHDPWLPRRDRGWDRDGAHLFRQGAHKQPCDRRGDT